MKYGSRILQKGTSGLDVEELQVRLSGFLGGTPDGIFGKGTETSVIFFQKSFMEMDSPSGIVDVDTFKAINEFGEKYIFNFETIKCPCGECNGFGSNLYKGIYRDGKPKIEAYYQYEYQGIHRSLLWGYMALRHLMSDRDFILNSGYRCSIRNKQTKRTSTNHQGKAIDIDVPLKKNETRYNDMENCDNIRAFLVENSNAQVAWNVSNKKALEPNNIAPTWVHYDVRCFEQRFLDDKFFCKSENGLLGSQDIALDFKNKPVDNFEKPKKEVIEEPIVPKQEEQPVREETATSPRKPSLISSILDMINAILSMFLKKG